MTIDIAILNGGPASRAVADWVAAQGASVALLSERDMASHWQVWSLGGGPLVADGACDQPFRIDLHDGSTLETFFTRTLIVCADENPLIVPFEGWTLPGVSALPAIGARASVAGAVVAMIDLSTHRILRALGGDSIGAVDLVSLASGQTHRVACDELRVSHGMTPDIRITQLYRARHAYRRDRGGWVAEHDDWGRSTVPRLYVTRDHSDMTAVTAALADLGLIDASRAGREIAGLTRHRAVVDCASSVPSPALFDAIPDDCVVCPCEGVARARIERAIEAGAREMNQLKQFTRCGMGPCQGRVCAETAAELLALHVGGREIAGTWTARTPLHPLPVAALLDGFDYADLPIPAAAPA